MRAFHMNRHAPFAQAPFPATRIRIFELPCGRYVRLAPIYHQLQTWRGSPHFSHQEHGREHIHRQVFFELRPIDIRNSSPKVMCSDLCVGVALNNACVCFAGKLKKKMTESKSPDQRPLVYVDGPHGHLAVDLKLYNTVVLVAGGKAALVFLFSGRKLYCFALTSPTCTFFSVPMHGPT